MPKLNSDHVELTEMRKVMPREHQAALDVIAQLYGNDSDQIINGLMDMTVRAAILAGVTAPNFAAGMKATWDSYAAHMNRASN